VVLSAIFEQIADLHEEFFLGTRFCGLLLGHFGGEAFGVVDALDHEEHHKGDDDEIDADGDKIPVGEHGSLFFCVDEAGRCDIARQCDELVRVVDAAGDSPDQGHDEILDEGRGELGKCSSHDEGHGHVDEVALEGEFLEFFEHNGFWGGSTMDL